MPNLDAGTRQSISKRAIRSREAVSGKPWNNACTIIGRIPLCLIFKSPAYRITSPWFFYLYQTGCLKLPLLIEISTLSLNFLFLEDRNIYQNLSNKHNVLPFLPLEIVFGCKIIPGGYFLNGIPVVIIIID